MPCTWIMNRSKYGSGNSFVNQIFIVIRVCKNWQKNTANFKDRSPLSEITIFCQYEETITCWRNVAGSCVRRGKQGLQSLILLLVRNNKVLPCMEKLYVMPNGLVVKPRGQLTKSLYNSAACMTKWKLHSTMHLQNFVYFILFKFDCTLIWYTYDIHPAFLFSDTGKDTPSRGEVL